MATRRRDPRARLERLEAMAGLHGPLGQGEAAELRHLEAERAAMFVGPIAAMTQAQLDAFLAYQAGAQAARLGHLRQRALLPQQQAEQRAHRISAPYLPRAAAGVAHNSSIVNAHRPSFGRRSPGHCPLVARWRLDPSGAAKALPGAGRVDLAPGPPGRATADHGSWRYGRRPRD